MESGEVDTLWVGGDLTSARFQGITELYVYVGGSVGEFVSQGPTEDLDVYVDNDLTTFSVRGSVSETDLDVDGNAGTVEVIGGAQEFDVDIDGTLETFLVRGSLDNSGHSMGDSIHVDGGITSFTVTEVIANSWIRTIDYDGRGNPIGGGIGTFRAGELDNVDVETHADIGEFVVDGAVTGLDIDTRAYDHYGGGDLVGGGGIGTFRALGLYYGDVHTFGAINEMRIGRGGISMYSEVGTYDEATGHLNLLQTPGFIFGEIYVAGNVTDILTGGADALPASDPIDFLFVDDNSFPTGGTLEVEGAILGTIS